MQCCETTTIVDLLIMLHLLVSRFVRVILAMQTDRELGMTCICRAAVSWAGRPGRHEMSGAASGQT